MLVPYPDRSRSTDVVLDSTAVDAGTWQKKIHTCTSCTHPGTTAVVLNLVSLNLGLLSLLVRMDYGHPGSHMHSYV